MASLTGWGKFTLVYLNDKEIAIKLHNNIANLKKQENISCCFYILGILSGFGEYIMKNVKVLETQCSVENIDDQYCEFLIQKIKL